MVNETEGEGQARLAVEVLDQFIKNGEDLRDERHVIHYLYGGNWEAMGPALTELGYEVRPTVNNDGVVAERYDVTDIDWADRTMRQMCEIAEIYDAEYDGWEGSMERQSPKAIPPAAPPTGLGFFTRLFNKKP